VKLIAHVLETEEVWQSKLCGFGLTALDLRSLMEDYGTPFVIIDETKSRETVEAFQKVTEPLCKSLRPSVRLVPGSWNDARSAHLFSPISVSATQELLRRLQEWRVGFLAWSASDVERALRAGARPFNVILCGAFKSRKEVVQAAHLGLRAVEVESLEELAELNSEDVQLACRTKPLRVTLKMRRLTCGEDTGLTPDELSFALERLRRWDHVVCVGLSIGWQRCGSIPLDEYEKLLLQSKNFAISQLASGHPLEFVMLGSRARREVGEQAGVEGHLELTKTIFEGSPFRVYFSCGDTIFGATTHVIGKVLRVLSDSLGVHKVVTDIVYPEGWPVSETGVSLTPPQERSSPWDSAQVEILGRRGANHAPVVLGRWRGRVPVAGSLVLLPSVGASFAAAAAVSCSLPRSPEILVGEEGECVVVRARGSLEQSLTTEV
jgi:diaminopimelate decarboxylase